MKFLVCRKAMLAIAFCVMPMAGQAQQTVTTTGGTSGYTPKFSGASTIVNSEIFDNGINVGIGVGKTPNTSVKLDVGGSMIMRGNMIVSRAGNATSSKGYPSYGFQFFSNAYNSSTKASDNPYFSLQSEPTGNNTASPSATFNLLFSNNGAAAAETGFYINPDGTLHFASAQTFPIAAGPQGPQGPQGPTGPTGPQGPAGTLTLPFYQTVDGMGSDLIQIGNSGASGGGGIFVQAAQANSTEYGAGGSGITVYGGNSTTTSGVISRGGPGLLSYGGDAVNNDSTAGYGAYLIGGNAYSSGSAGGIGVYAVGGGAYDGVSGGTAVFAEGINGGYAGVFEGAVSVSGNLSKPAGSFKIDHPLDPANKYLYHSFVESPDMMNIYNGNVVTNGSGEAVVTMPDYFEALNRDFRYQLTTIGQPAQAYIAAEISNGSFVIKTDKPGVKVSWQVTGVRQDAWANAHRIPLEEDKAEAEKGHYLHPELYGHAGEPSIPELKNPRPKQARRQ